MGEGIISSDKIYAERYKKNIENIATRLSGIRPVQITEGNAAAVENANNKYAQLAKLSARTCDVAVRDADRIVTIAEIMEQQDKLMMHTYNIR